MRVLMVAPLWFGIGLNGPGGIETLLAALTRALDRAGCDVTLLAAAGSDAGVRTIEVVSAALFDEMRAGRAWDQLLYEQHELLVAHEQLREHDVCHSFLGPSGFALSGEGPVLHTIQGQVTQDLRWFVGARPDLPLTVPASPQAEDLRAAGARRCRVVPNGVNFDGFPLGNGDRRGLVFLGRMEEEKGPDLAIDVAAELGEPLVLAGPVIDRAFFAEAVEPRLGGGVRYAGVLGHDERCELLATSACTLMPSRWAEPFGMVAVESMACGTPVVALANGGLAEVVDDGVTGFRSSDEAGLAGLVERTASLEPGAIREHAASRFSIDAIAARYIETYRELPG
jgi:glycosyltransferase involved in cell wall biosynthesis